MVRQRVVDRALELGRRDRHLAVLNGGAVGFRNEFVGGGSWATADTASLKELRDPLCLRGEINAPSVYT